MVLNPPLRSHPTAMNTDWGGGGAYYSLFYFHSRLWRLASTRNTTKAHKNPITLIWAKNVRYKTQDAYEDVMRRPLISLKLFNRCQISVQLYNMGAAWVLLVRLGYFFFWGGVKPTFRKVFDEVKPLKKNILCKKWKIQRLSGGIVNLSYRCPFTPLRHWCTILRAKVDFDLRKSPCLCTHAYFAHWQFLCRPIWLSWTLCIIMVKSLSNTTLLYFKHLNKSLNIIENRNNDNTLLQGGPPSCEIVCFDLPSPGLRLLHNVFFEPQPI